MSVAIASAIALLPNSSPVLRHCSPHQRLMFRWNYGTRRKAVYKSTRALKNSRNFKRMEIVEEETGAEMGESSESLLYGLSPVSLLLLGALPGAGTVRTLFGPAIELVKLWNLPEWLVHWGHPGNMEEKAKAKDLHPKLVGGMFFFFALGATGGITSLLTSDRPILDSPHAVTGFIGLTLLTIQTVLPALFEGNPGLRNAHGILGSGIML